MTIFVVKHVNLKYMAIKNIVAFGIALVMSVASSAMEQVSLDTGWKFKKGSGFGNANDGETVDLPHSWNTADGMFGGDYYRGSATYTKMLDIPVTGEESRYFLKVNAAQTVADIFVDNRWIGQHRGGYTAFVVEMSRHVTPGKSHKLDIVVNNSPVSDVAPISGDFNIFGGLTRGVELLVTAPVCIAPDFYASDGVFFAQRSVSADAAEIDVEVHLSDTGQGYKGYTVVAELTDGDDIVAAAWSAAVASDGVVALKMSVANPHLWNGVADPFMYKGIVRLEKDGMTVDSRSVNVGLRYYGADADKGFYLNGERCRLVGANVHQDRAERGAAYRAEDFDETVDMALDLGCNALRLAHYPHSEEMYDRMDLAGLVAWTELPFVNIYISNPAYEDNLKMQLKELVYQKFNHPCVLAWGLFNEANSGWMEPVDGMIASLDSLARAIDPTRPTIGASNQNDSFNSIPSYIAFNKYFGWYGDNPADLADWIDAEHAAHPDRAMGISEYGAGASVFQQSDSLVHPEPWGQWHPENWQTYYHIENWKILSRREFLWCNFIWCLADFSSAGRKEGDTFGRNDKGLVTYDRTIKKDAYYFYKANWNKDEPVLYIAGRRNRNVESPTVDIMAFGNRGAAGLTVNGVSYGVAEPDEVNVMTWRGVPLSKGANEIVVTDSVSRDSCVKVLR